jgi:hypothetical protein
MVLVLNARIFLLLYWSQQFVQTSLTPCAEKYNTTENSMSSYYKPICSLSCRGFIESLRSTFNDPKICPPVDLSKNAALEESRQRFWNVESNLFLGYCQQILGAGSIPSSPGIFNLERRQNIEVENSNAVKITPPRPAVYITPPTVSATPPQTVNAQSSSIIIKTDECSLGLYSDIKNLGFLIPGDALSYCIKLLQPNSTSSTLTSYFYKSSQPPLLEGIDPFLCSNFTNTYLLTLAQSLEPPTHIPWLLSLAACLLLIAVCGLYAFFIWSTHWSFERTKAFQPDLTWTVKDILEAEKKNEEEIEKEWEMQRTLRTLARNRNRNQDQFQTLQLQHQQGDGENDQSGTLRQKMVLRSNELENASIHSGHQIQLDSTVNTAVDLSKHWQEYLEQEADVDLPHPLTLSRSKQSITGNHSKPLHRNSATSHASSINAYPQTSFTGAFPASSEKSDSILFVKLGRHNPLAQTNNTTLPPPVQSASSNPSTLSRNNNNNSNSSSLNSSPSLPRSVRGIQETTHRQLQNQQQHYQNQNQNNNNDNQMNWQDRKLEGATLAQFSPRNASLSRPKQTELGPNATTAISTLPRNPSSSSYFSTQAISNNRMATPKPIQAPPAVFSSSSQTFSHPNNQLQRQEANEPNQPLNFQQQHSLSVSYTDLHARSNINKSSPQPQLPAQTQPAQMHQQQYIKQPSDTTHQQYYVGTIARAVPYRAGPEDLSSPQIIRKKPTK